MFKGAYRDVITTNHRTPLRIDHIFGQCIDYRLIFQIDSLYFVTMIYRCRVEGYHNMEAGMQSGSA